MPSIPDDRSCLIQKRPSKKAANFINGIIPRDTPGYAIHFNDLMYFSFIDDSMCTKLLDKVTLGSLDFIPPCTKYISPPSSITFIDRDSKFYPETLIPYTLDIKKWINLDYDFYLDLDPRRFDRVKKAIVNGEIDMPVLTVNNLIPELMDGRHRLVALYRYGFKDAEVLIPEEHLSLIQRYISKPTQPKDPPEYFTKI